MRHRERPIGIGVKAPSLDGGAAAPKRHGNRHGRGGRLCDAQHLGLVRADSAPLPQGANRSGNHEQHDGEGGEHDGRLDHVPHHGERDHSHRTAHRRPRAHIAAQNRRCEEHPDRIRIRDHDPAIQAEIDEGDGREHERAARSPELASHAQARCKGDRHAEAADRRQDGI